MKEILMFYLEHCPYCKKAEKLEKELMLSYPEFKSVMVRRINEDLNREFCDKFNYKLVPSYYIEGKKIHEGDLNLEDVKKVFEKAMT